MNLSSIDDYKEKEMTKLFHIKIQFKKAKEGSLFNLGSQANITTMDMVKKVILEVHNYPSPYPLGLENKDMEIKVIKQCKIKFIASVYYIN